MSLHAYFMDRAPVVLPERTAEYTCVVCGKKGWGAPNTRAHPGRCHAQHVRERARKSALARKARRAAS
jgi:hypothetical protein